MTLPSSHQSQTTSIMQTDPTQGPELKSQHMARMLNSPIHSYVRKAFNMKQHLQSIPLGLLRQKCDACISKFDCIKQ